MSHYLSIQVLDKNHHHVRGVEVQIVVQGILDGGTLEGHTDSAGHVQLTTVNDYDATRKLWIRVRGKSFGPYSVAQGSHTVTLG